MMTAIRGEADYAVTRNNTTPMRFVAQELAVLECRVLLDMLGTGFRNKKKALLALENIPEDVD